MTISPGRYSWKLQRFEEKQRKHKFWNNDGILWQETRGINTEGEFLTTESMVSILPQDSNPPCSHFFTWTPDPEKSVFKPFIFVPNISQLVDTNSPIFELEDPVKKEPHCKIKPDRRNPLYQDHQ